MISQYSNVLMICCGVLVSIEIYRDEIYYGIWITHVNKFASVYSLMHVVDF